MKDEKAEVYIRVLDDNHRVCIPIQVRQEMEVSPGCSIEFLADGDRIILRKYGQEVSSIFWTLSRARAASRVSSPGLSFRVSMGVSPAERVSRNLYLLMSRQGHLIQRQQMIY